MKEFYKNTKSKKTSPKFFVMANILAFLFLFWLGQAVAAPVAIVKELSGNAFSLVEGKAHSLKVGDLVEDMSEIVTEMGSQVTFMDYYNHVYHLASAGHVQIMRRLIDLRAGHLWVQTKGDGGVSLIQTANAKVTYNLGEAIVSYDSESGKTQVLSVRGQFDMCNQLLEDVVVAISEGHFSFIQKDVDNGVPRNPTPIGSTSFKQVTGLFIGIDPLLRSMTAPVVAPAQPALPSRVPASVPAETTVPQAPAAPGGDIVYLKKEERVAPRDLNMAPLLSEKLAEAKKIKPKKIWKRENEYKQTSNVKINVYGIARDKVVSRPVSPTVQASRAPASIMAPAVPRATAEGTPGKDSFESTLTEKYKQQMRHNEEVNHLIDQLKNYEQDFKKNY
ncbi:MAG: hypothetical protein A2X86_19220 [Bdellovibrionales bacterium GWA2_49_15]|nr:MAG: hypothetical protein A2X86_19220 [Bdellovibrionales bacterium GWA2_49_15]HAZ14360.1 hypothetical protein [Bdellovibrionales bacterium]